MSDTPDNPYLIREARTRNLTKSHRRSRDQERELAAKLGGRVTPASGAGQVKGDVRVRGLMRIECKTTCKASFSVTRDMVRKIEAAALSGSEVPAIVVEFNDDGRKVMEVAVVPLYVLQGLVDVSKS